MRLLELSLLTVALMAAPKPGVFTGVISDSMCERGNHSQMRMGPTNAECVKACVEEHDAKYVLFSGRKTYALSDQNSPEKFAGLRVLVTGQLDVRTGTIQVESISAAK